MNKRRWSIREENELKRFFLNNIPIGRMATLLERDERSIIQKASNMQLIRVGDNKTFEIVLNEVITSFGIPFYILNSKNKKKEIVEARQACHYLAKELTNASLSSIGAFFFNKDHGTVINSNKRIKNLIETEVDFKDKIENIEKKCNLKIKKLKKGKINFCNDINYSVIGIKKEISNIHLKIEFNKIINKLKNG